MSRRPLLVIGLFVVLAFALTWSAAAQGPLPKEQDEPTVVAPEPGTPNLGSATSAPSAPAVVVGQPGTVFRYVQTFGYTETAWLEDSNHLDNPYGLTTDGTSVWIADSLGLRAMKFNGATGAFMTQIGKAGARYGIGVSNADLDWISDVAVDGGGNIWIVDMTLSHALKLNSSGAYQSKLGTSYSSGADNAHFNSPRGIAFDSHGDIYVSDGGNHRVQIYNSAGSYSQTIGITAVPTSTNAGFNNPRHITIDSSDLLYVPDTSNNRVQVFDVSNPSAINYVATIGGTYGSGSNQFKTPQGVYVDSTRIYVADLNNHRVQIFDRTTRAYIASIGTGMQGGTNNQFSWPSDVSVDASGYIYIADQGNHRVQQFDSGLNYVRTYGTTGVPYLTDNSHFNQPSGMAVAADGSIYLTEVRGNRLIKLDSAGVAQWVVGAPGVSGSDNAHFNSPWDTAVGPDGRVYVADSSNHRIQVFNPDGSYYTTIGSGYGTGNYNFSYPRGVFVAPDNTLYVADQQNHRVQIFNSSGSYIATLGVTGVSGSDNAHFNVPADVVVDGNGTIYVSEETNARVQVFSSGYAYMRTIGGAAKCTGRDLFDEFCGPHQMAVDTRNNLYLADSWANRVQVFDSGGAYLTTIGHSYGNRTGQLRMAMGVALDRASNLYVADNFNHRVQKFALGVPGWRQVNINGFGDPRQAVNAMGVFVNQLYVGTSGPTGQVWRTADGQNWSPVITDASYSADSFAVFSNTLYLGTWDQVHGAGIHRTPDGVNWTNVVTAGFGITTNSEVISMVPYNGNLYAATVNDNVSATIGGQIWRSADGLNWTNEITNNFGLGPTNSYWWAFEEFKGLLYVGTGSAGGGILYRTDGTTWTLVTTNGFGDTSNNTIPALATFNGYLYAATRNSPANGAQVWRSSTGDPGSWSRVAIGGLGDTNSNRAYGLIVFDGRLYLIITNVVAGDQVWRSVDGLRWEHVGFDGWGDSNNNYSDYSDKAAAVFNGHLFIGTENSANGGEVWEYLDKQLFLPLIRR